MECLFSCDAPWHKDTGTLCSDGLLLVYVLVLEVGLRSQFRRWQTASSYPCSASPSQRFKLDHFQVAPAMISNSDLFFFLGNMFCYLILVHSFFFKFSLIPEFAPIWTYFIDFFF